MPVIIAPSLLAADFTRLGKDVARIHASGADWLHLDIMDGNFVPNISFGPGVVKGLRPLTRMFFDVHLMCVKPEILLEPFATAGAHQITVHVELGNAVPGLLWRIKSLGKQVGLAVNPPTSISHVLPHLPLLDFLLIMTVNPGFGGQSFIHEVVPKIQQASAWRRDRGLKFRIGVDGGVDDITGPECARAGADTFISGTALFRQHSLRRAVARFRRLVAAAASPAVEEAKGEELAHG